MAESNVRILMAVFNTLEGINVDMLTAALNKGMDWTIVVNNCILIKTTSDAQRWYGRFEPLLSDTHTVFICRVDLNDRQGILPKYVWDWIDRETQSPTSTALSTPASFSELLNPPPKKS